MNDRTHHERWDALALGHVLGGLPDADASEFRGHLVGCRQCRARVAELRSLASDLDAVEHEERVTQRIRTQTESRRELSDPGEEATRDRPRSLLLLGVAVAAILLGGLSFWNAHLRAQQQELVELAELQERTISVLGAGSVVAARTSSESVTGVVAVDGDRVAYSLAGLPVPSSGEVLVVWLEVDEQWESRAVHTPRQVDEGRLASTLAAVDASRMMVTVESAVVPDAPGDDPVLEADLDEARSDA